MAVNKVIVLGVLNSEPRMKETLNKNPMCLFTIETRENRRDRDGKPYEIFDSHNVLTFGQVAERCGKLLRKGSKLYIEGRIRSRTWVDKKAVEHQSYSIIPEKIEFLPTRGERYQELSNEKNPYETDIRVTDAEGVLEMASNEEDKLSAPSFQQSEK